MSDFNWINWQNNYVSNALLFAVFQCSLANYFFGVFSIDLVPRRFLKSTMKIALLSCYRALVLELKKSSDCVSLSPLKHQPRDIHCRLFLFVEHMAVGVECQPDVAAVSGLCLRG